jgi:hypothetical protein
MYKDYNMTQLTLPMETSVLIPMISMDLSETSNYMNMMIAQNIL